MLSPAQTLLIEAARLNRDAIALAAQGHVIEASTVLRQALDILVHLTGDDAIDRTGTVGQLSNLPRRAVSAIALPFSKDVECFCIYNSLLLFEPRTQIAPTAGVVMELDVSYYSSAIIFNLALLYHQRAAVTGSSKFYRAANSMYAKGLDIIQNFPQHGDADMAALKLSILNNQAHIHLQLVHSSCDADAGGAAEESRNMSSALLQSGTDLPQLKAGMISEILLNTLMTSLHCASTA